MAVFDFLKKKKEFPEFPRLPAKTPRIPTYESPLKEFKTPEEFTFPERKPVFELPPVVREEIPRVVREEIPREKQPIFVKLAKYREAVRLVKEINDKLQESEKILSHLLEIEAKEDAEIEKWKEELSSIKTKLMEIDRNLFEA